MNVADVRPGLAECLGQIRLLDVHVVQVGEQLHVPQCRAGDELRAIRERVDQVRLVAIERLVEKRHSQVLGVLVEFEERIAEVPQRDLPRYRTRGAALHRADDGRRVEPRREVHHPLDERNRLARERRHPAM